MNLKSLITVSALVVSLFSQTSSAVLPPLSQEEREASATDILTGYVTSVRKVVGGRSRFSNTHYTVQMIVSDISKGHNALGGETVSFHYWKELDSPSGWCGDSGQFDSIKHYQVIKAYLTFDELTNSFHLLNPNGFDLLRKR